MKRTKKPAPQQTEMNLTVPTLGELVAWIEAEHLPPGDSRRGYLRQFVESLPRKPSAGDIYEVLQARVHAGQWAATTANMRKRVLGSAYEVAQRKWPLLVNIVRDVPTLPEPVEPPKCLRDPPQTYPLCLRAMPDARARAYVGLQRWLGLRKSEALGIPRVGGINWSTGHVRIIKQRDEDTIELKDLKTNTSAATMPIPPFLLQDLRAAYLTPLRRNAGECERRFVFPYFGRELAELMGRLRAVSPEDFPETVQGVRGGCAWHVFRHTFGYELVHRYRREPTQVQRWMRHKKLSSTQSYIGRWFGEAFDEEGLKAFWKEIEAGEVPGAAWTQPPIPAPESISAAGGPTNGKDE